jgi:hypothetical protein
MATAGLVAPEPSLDYSRGMPEMHGPYHRTGEPGGPGAAVAALEIEGRGPDGKPEPGHLVAAQGDAGEVELLRTICHSIGITWGHDDFGWWAAVPARLTRRP